MVAFINTSVTEKDLLPSLHLIVERFDQNLQIGWMSVLLTACLMITIFQIYLSNSFQTSVFDVIFTFDAVHKHALQHTLLIRKPSELWVSSCWNRPLIRCVIFDFKFEINLKSDLVSLSLRKIGWLLFRFTLLAN